MILALASIFMEAQFFVITVLADGETFVVRPKSLGTGNKIATNATARGQRESAVFFFLC